jgi:hypothetical protein
MPAIGGTAGGGQGAPIPLPAPQILQDGQLLLAIFL